MLVIVPKASSLSARRSSQVSSGLKVVALVMIGLAHHPHM
jgi:hypothetical protein